MFKSRKYILLLVIATAIVTILLGSSYYFHAKEKEVINIAYEKYQKDQVRLWLLDLHANIIKTYQLDKDDYYYHNLLNEKKIFELSEKDSSDLLYVLYQTYNKSGLAKSGDTAIGVFLKKEQPISEVSFVYASIDDKTNHIIQLKKDFLDKWNIINIDSQVGGIPIKVQTLSKEEFIKNFNN
ncbi:hypothetical protein GCM10008018_07910 [Paenibacillus marchantiophytorum]|uniref:DUF4825 domain-containing protein n=1 Tax=Paenibacillus marchantiophytorum TaxID=1619310 RepID=A0ABQ2BPN9_9BACL|nr:hypothetical protein [Paenibacillus marchantiophytorum]GGI44599.1 hypothetical protein GCM10008018_07910 [Paenibacillus marchantiophytorum]